MAGYDFGKARVAIVTGGGSGIGRALCLGLARRGLKALVVADIDLPSAEGTAKEILALGLGASARAVRCDVTSEAEIDRLVSESEAHEGPVDAFFANAGVVAKEGRRVDCLSAEGYHRTMAVNVSHVVLAARRLLPALAERGGCFAVTASAVGLLVQLGALSYTASKHAARAVAEWLAVTYGAAGLHVACLCPLAVDTPMLAPFSNLEAIVGSDPMISADDASESLLLALESGRFLALPHPAVEQYMKKKAEDVDEWIKEWQQEQMRVFGSVLLWPKDVEGASASLSKSKL